MGLGRLLKLTSPDPARTAGAAVRLPARRRFELFLIPAVICFLGLLSMVLLAWMSHINELQRRHALQIDAIMEMQIRAATFHFSLEEQIRRTLDGVPTADVAEVWRELDRALSLSRTVLHGGISERGSRLPPLSNPGLRIQAEAIHGQLRQLRVIATERLGNIPRAGVSSALDERFDRIFRDVQQNAYAIESILESAEVRSRLQWRRLAAGLLSLWVVIVGFATIGVYRYQRARVRMEAEIREARQALERANRELESRVREKTESLQAANAALTRKISECSLAEEALLSHQDRLRELSSQLTLAEERERRRIATELHDRIGTALAFAKMKLVSSPQPIPGGAANDARAVAESLALIEQAIEDTRSLTFELSAPALYELGFEPALEWLAERTERQHHLRVEVEHDGCSKDMAEDLRVLLFQAVRELLVNVVKHARARHVRIECRRDAADLRIVVEDDGVGFQGRDWLRLQSPDGGFGLFSIRERLGAVGGALEVESSAAGSRVTLLVPLAAGEQREGSP